MLRGISKVDRERLGGELLAGGNGGFGWLTAEELGDPTQLTDGFMRLSDEVVLGRSTAWIPDSVNDIAPNT